MRCGIRNVFAVAALVAVLVACSKPADVPPPPAAARAASPADQANGIAWRKAADDTAVDAAFAQARAEGKPVFLYWGADWCPPCNQLQATLFNRQDFIERSRAFVPVYIDGDSPGAQKLGARFKVRGYPTTVLFSPAGEELTRLPGEVEAAQYTQVLTLGMNHAQRPLKAVLADARAGGAGVSPSDWTLLAFYSWETDEQEQLVSAKLLPTVLKQLAANCPAEQADAGTRLFLKAWAASPDRAGAADEGARARLLAVLRNAEPSRVQMDVLANNAVELVRALSASKTAPRLQLLEAFDASLAGLANDVTLSRADRLSALIARVQLARLDAPKGAAPAVPAVTQALLSDVREHVARVDRETTDGFERQAVIGTAAYLLREAGVADEADTLLKASLAKSHSPYYLMLGLATNARQRRDSPEALRWYEEAFKRSEGPATRLQWGATYVGALVDLAPQDGARIEQAAQQVFSEAVAQPNAFYERSARSLKSVGGKLQTWHKQTGHAAEMKRLQAQLDDLCARVPEADAQRSTCLGLLKAS